MRRPPAPVRPQAPVPSRRDRAGPGPATVRGGLVGALVLACASGLAAAPALAEGAGYVTPGMNRNQLATARQIERVEAGQGSDEMAPMFALIAGMESDSAVTDAVDRLSAQDYAATVADAFYSSQRFGETIRRCDYYTQAAPGQDPGTCYWVMASQSDLSRDPSFQYRGYDSDESSLTGGVQIPIGDGIEVGYVFGFEDISMTNGERFSADGTRASLGFTLLQTIGRWEIYGMVDGSSAEYDGVRRIGISGSLADGQQVSAGTARVAQRVNTASARAGAGYRWQGADDRVYLRPGLDLDVTYLSSHNANESGTDYGLRLDQTSQWIMSVTPSLELGGTLARTAGRELRGYLRGAVTFADADEIHVDATFAGAVSADGQMRNYTGISDRTQILTAGLTLASATGRVYYGLAYQGLWDDAFSGQTAGLNIGIRF